MMYRKTIFHILLIVLIIITILFVFHTATHNWCVEHMDQWRGELDMFMNGKRDEVFEVPEKDRSPPGNLSVREFNRQKEDILLQHILRTHSKYPEQRSFGSVMTDGYHADLPENMAWRNGKIVFIPPS